MPFQQSFDAIAEDVWSTLSECNFNTMNKEEFFELVKKRHMEGHQHKLEQGTFKKIKITSIKKQKLKFDLPFMPDYIDYEQGKCCCAIVANSDLFTPCSKECAEDSTFCKYHNDEEKVKYGTIQDRLKKTDIVYPHTIKQKDGETKEGKKEIKGFGTVCQKKNITIEQVFDALQENGLRDSLFEDALEEEYRKCKVLKKKTVRGRPKGTPEDPEESEEELETALEDPMKKPLGSPLGVDVKEEETSDLDLDEEEEPKEHEEAKEDEEPKEDEEAKEEDEEAEQVIKKIKKKITKEKKEASDKKKKETKEKIQKKKNGEVHIE